MSKLVDPTPVKYFCSCLWNPSVDIKPLLAEHFEISGSLEPDFNPLVEYYSKEMGEDLNRVIFWDDRLFPRDRLVDLKLWSSKIERKNSKNNKRLVNIDVGYIAKEHVILATGKPYSHRIYLNSGVFAELVYTYSDKTFKSLPWTYPDYQAEEKISLFNRIR